MVKDLAASYDIINSKDKQGNTALHIAAYRGYLSVIEVLVSTFPSSTSLTNNHGDTFLHMVVAGFRTPGFRRVDQQIELMKHLVRGKFLNLHDIINIRNNDGRTAIHMAVMEDIHSDLVELLLTVQGINLSIRDADDMTPLDVLKQRPRSASSEVLMKRLISAGGTPGCQDYITRNALVSHLKLHRIEGSPGTSFRVPDAEMVLFTDAKNAYAIAYDPASTEYETCSGGFSPYDSVDRPSSFENNRLGSVNYATRHLKLLFKWPKRKTRQADDSEYTRDDDSLESYCMNNGSPKYNHVPLRERFSNRSSLLSSKRILPFRSNFPSPSTKKKFASGLMHGVLQVKSRSVVGSPSSHFSQSSISSPISFDKQKGVDFENDGFGSSCSKSQTYQKHGSFNKRLMNQYFCFGAQGLAVEDSVHCTRKAHQNRRSFLH